MTGVFQCDFSKPFESYYANLSLWINLKAHGSDDDRLQAFAAMGLSSIVVISSSPQWWRRGRLIAGVNLIARGDEVCTRFYIFNQIVRRMLGCFKTLLCGLVPVVNDRAVFDPVLRATALASRLMRLGSCALWDIFFIIVRSWLRRKLVAHKPS